jgi:hypothetical protein
MICKVVDQQAEAHTLITTHGAIAAGLQQIHIKEDHREYLEKVQAQAVLYSVAAIFAHTVCSAVKLILVAEMPAEASTGI